MNDEQIHEYQVINFSSKINDPFVIEPGRLRMQKPLVEKRVLHKPWTWFRKHYVVTYRFEVLP